MDTNKETNNINPKKVTINNNIPPKISKKCSKVSASVSHKPFTNSIESSEFLQNLKLAEIANKSIRRMKLYIKQISTCQHITSSIKIFRKNN